MVILDQRPTTTEKEEEEELDVGMNFQLFNSCHSLDKRLMRDKPLF
jgi:hypothetical protein